MFINNKIMKQTLYIIVFLLVAIPVGLFAYDYSAERTYYSPAEYEDDASAQTYRASSSSFSDSYYREQFRQYDQFLSVDPTRTALYADEDASSSESSSKSGPLRARPESWDEPDSALPVGDVPWALVALFVALSVAFKAYRTHKSPFNGN